MKRRVVVTGVGLVTPVGNSVEATWSALMQGRSGVDYIKKFDTEHPHKFPVRFAAEVKDFDVTPYMDRPGAILVDDVSLNAAFSDWSNATRPDYVALVATELEDHPIGVALLL